MGKTYEGLKFKPSKSGSGLRLYFWFGTSWKILGGNLASYGARNCLGGMQVSRQYWKRPVEINV